MKEEPTPEPAHPKAATSTSTSSSTPHPPRGQSPSRQRKASHAPPAETPSRTQPERGARHATPSAPVPTVVPPTLPEEITAAQIGNNNFYVATDCRLDGKNLKNAKGKYIILAILMSNFSQASTAICSSTSTHTHSWSPWILKSSTFPTTST